MSILEDIDATERYYKWRIETLEMEVEHWRDKYSELLVDSIRHGDDMFGFIFKAALDGVIGSPKSSDAVARAEGSDHELTTRDNSTSPYSSLNSGVARHAESESK